jgi:hypothetical protein
MAEKDPLAPELLIQLLSERSVEIDERKLDFLLGDIRTGPAAEKSTQRGKDFRE